MRTKGNLKTCKCCNDVKLKTDFGRKESRFSGHMYYDPVCKECRNEENEEDIQSGGDYIEMLERNVKSRTSSSDKYLSGQSSWGAEHTDWSGK